MRNIFNIFEQLKLDREMMEKKFHKLVEQYHEASQVSLEFSKSNQLDLWAA